MSFKDEKRPIGGCWFTAGVQRTEAGKGEGRRNGDPFPERKAIGYVRFPRHSDYAGDCRAGGDENQIGKVCQRPDRAIRFLPETRGCKSNVVKAGLLTRPVHRAFPVSKPVAKSAVNDFSRRRGHTAASTVPESHRIPFSSGAEARTGTITAQR